MQKPHMIAYIVISGLTPALVLINCMFGNAASPKLTTPFQSMQLTQWLVNSGPEKLVTAYEFRPTELAGAPQARIVSENGQYFLEFYNPFSMTPHTPKVMLLLNQAATPDEDVIRSDRYSTIGKLQPTAGKQRYAIAASVDVHQYLSVIVWCPEFDVIMGYASLTFEV